MQKYHGPLTITHDAAEYVITNPTPVLARLETLLVLSMGQLQKLAKQSKAQVAVTQAMGLPELADWLSNFTRDNNVHLVTKHHGQILAAVNGEVSATPHDGLATDYWRVTTATQSCVWWLQHITKPFEAISSSFVA
jgi:hypothetical protein